jgi:hypothetical protein
MGSSVSFYCGPDDHKALFEFALSIGLHLIPPDDSRPISDNPKEGPFCYLSHSQLSELVPYGPHRRYTYATHPLIEFLRAYYDPPYLVSGRLYWSNDVRDLASVTKPYFIRLARWVRTNWQKVEKHAFYFGPQAQLLFRAQGAIPRTFPLGVEIEEIRMGSKTPNH